MFGNVCKEIKSQQKICIFLLYLHYIVQDGFFIFYLIDSSKNVSKFLYSYLISFSEI